MPRLWNDTIAAHRREVRDAIIQTTASLVSANGLRAVTMSQIAETTGIGRATLYKYFPSVEAILVAWHERQVEGHLQDLEEIRDRAGDAGERLEGVFLAYALMLHDTQTHHDSELAALVHGEHVAERRDRLHALVRELLEEAVQQGDVRNDVPADELATYCLYALSASRRLRSPPAIARLVAVTRSGLRPR